MTPAMLSRRPRILYLGAYDSFSNNIIAQIEQCVDADVVTCFIDDDLSCKQSKDPTHTDVEKDVDAQFLDYVKGFDAVVAGSGPGWATCDADVGITKELWKLQELDLLPVLGIGLGFQSMCLAFGGSIERLDEPRHGVVSEILHNRSSIFSGMDRLLATQYHSLQAMVGHRMQVNRAVRYPAELWEATKSCPLLEPLAWDFDSKRNGAVLMAAKHTHRPFWGVQFHPESIYTNSEGTRLIQTWWHDAQQWQRRRAFTQITRRTSRFSTPSGTMSIDEIRSLFKLQYPQLGNEAMRSEDGDSSSDSNVSSVEDELSGIENLSPEKLANMLANVDGQTSRPISVQYTLTSSRRLTTSDIVEAMNIPRGEAILLESGLRADLLPVTDSTSRYSIIGRVIPRETMRLHYYAGRRMMQLRNGNDKVHHEWQTSRPWQHIGELMKHLRSRLHQPPRLITHPPFWGGLMGYASYEAGLETIGIEAKGKATYPDICFAYITRSIVIDHHTKMLHVQSLRGPDDETWIHDTISIIIEAMNRKGQESSPSSSPLPRPDAFEQDVALSPYIASCKEHVADREKYCASVSSCQSHIADGQSYELYFTTANEVRARKPRICRLSKSEDNELSWKHYKRLTARNPVPFSAYMRLHNVHILSSSPGRYISWDRSQAAHCRPIRGTVAKRPGLDVADAQSILSSSKERAENLTMVELVRHQLHGVYGSGNVHVRQLMEVEEYETLWQLVSVIEAVHRDAHKPPPPEEWVEPPTIRSMVKPVKRPADYLGFDAFVQSLPPGSMTGAPKKRSCELLQREEEQQRRGIYSGVLGYLDIGGGGDFSVVTRTAVKIDDSSSLEDVWTIGTGSAITAQSDPDAAYDEMMRQFHSTALPFKLQSASDSMTRWERLSRVCALMNEDVDDENDEANEAPLLATLEHLQAQLLRLQAENEESLSEER